MFFIKKDIIEDMEIYEIKFFNKNIVLRIYNKSILNIIFYDDIYSKISVNFKYSKNKKMFEKYLIIFLKDLYYNYIHDGIYFNEFKEQLKELINNHFGG